MTFRLIIYSIFLVSGLINAYTIILDPGHGGVYGGMRSVGGKLLEKNVALDVAQKTAVLLRKRRYTVILTRETDKEFDKNDLIKDLTQRAEMTRTHKADIFVSIHFNSSKSPARRGYEVYVPYKKVYPAKSYQLASKVHHELSQSIRPDFGGGTLGNLNNGDGGIHAAAFNVLMKAQCPAILLELDFLSNVEAEQDLMTCAYRNKLARAVADGIHRFFQ